MSEELLKAIIKLFAIVAKERITEAEKSNIKEFLSVHLNDESASYYLNLFEDYVREYKIEKQDGLNIDDETLEFVDEWSNIIKISREVNKALTITQKMVLVIKIIELIYADGNISERQNNLIFYIGEALKIPQRNINSLRNFVMGEDYDELSSSDILIVDDGGGDVNITGPRVVANNMTGLLAILRIPETETYFIKYLGISVLYLNGISLKSRKIDVFPTGSTIRGNKIHTIYYSDILNRFLTSRVKSKITFTAEHVFYHFKSGRVGLQNVNIAEDGGRLVGIMGASGSGKSTLLSVLNGTDKPSSGRVIINGIDIHDEAHSAEGLIGYVPQDDFLFNELSVFDNLYYAVKLCFKDYSHDQSKELVEVTLQNLGLLEIKDLKVGSPMDKTISGGQRKRLNIGLELLREPSVLFVDEPTSGLSSRDSENIMDLMKELSFRGKMVFVVIHQPSSDIFKMFDTLLILDTGGFPIYYGNPVESVTYFKEIINAANKSQSSCPECGNINPEQVFNIIETRIVNEFGRLTPVRKVSPGQWYQYFKDNILMPKIKHVKEKLEVVQSIPGLLTQFSVFFIRDVKSKLSDKQYLLINLLEAPVLALFMGFMVRYYATVEVDNADYSFSKNDNIPVYYFMSIIVALFMGLTVSAEEIFRDRMILKRERFLNLSRFSYLSSKVGVLFIISAIQTSTFVLIGDLILEINGMGLRFLLIMFSTSCFANLLGLNISASFNSAVTIYILIPILLIPQLLLSGVVVEYDKFNPNATSIDKVPLFGDVMVSRWAFEASMVTQYKDNPFMKKMYAAEKQKYDADYMLNLYLQRLDSELSYCYNNRRKKYTEKGPEFEKSVALLKSELTKEFNNYGQDIPDWMDDMTLQRFDTATFHEASKAIDILSGIYRAEYYEADRRRSDLVTGIRDEDFNHDSLKSIYFNEAVAIKVTNRSSTVRIVNVDGELVRKVNYIYDTKLNPANYFDYRTSFYSPVKYFAGVTFDTLVFNMLVIWAMSLILFIALYFDGLKKAINFFVPYKKRKGQRQRKFV